MQYEMVCGVETHVQLKTRTKMFCGCEVRFGAPPNSLVCPVCLGHPGVLPVLNREAFDLALRVALALNCEVAPSTKFDRKNYFYPDLPKSYQISQYDLPYSHDGWLDIGTKKIGVIRAHLEEDAGKLIHEENGARSFVDLNRCGVPLVEIVTRPDLRSADEVHAYLTSLKAILQYIGVSDCDMEKGELRCDINVSVRPKGSEALGVKAEVKNLNSFRNARAAIEFEFGRQRKSIEAGERIVQETRLYDAGKNVTRAMRSKEEAHDYRYFPEPDLPPVRIGKEWIDRARASLPELPAARRERFAREYALSGYDAENLTKTKWLADYFEGLAKLEDAKTAANWLQNEYAQLLNERKLSEPDVKMSVQELAELLALVKKGTITRATGKEVLAELLFNGGSPKAFVQSRGLAIVSDAGELEAVARKVVDANPKAVADFKGGKEATLKFLIGQIMREMKGRANPKGAEEALRKILIRENQV